jgi:hypothetical protein
VREVRVRERERDSGKKKSTCWRRGKIHVSKGQMAAYGTNAAK